MKRKFVQKNEEESPNLEERLKSRKKHRSNKSRENKQAKTKNKSFGREVFFSSPFFSSGLSCFSLSLLLFQAPNLLFFLLLTSLFAQSIIKMRKGGASGERRGRKRWKENRSSRKNQKSHEIRRGRNEKNQAKFVLFCFVCAAFLPLSRSVWREEQKKGLARQKREWSRGG